MKTFKYLSQVASLCAVLLLAAFQGAYAQETKEEKSAALSAAVLSLLESKNYVFQVQSVAPRRGGMLQQSPGFKVVVSKDSVSGDLPYFGRAYNAAYGSSDGGIKFTSTNFDYKKEDRKKGGWSVKFTLKQQKSARQLSFTIAENGSASLYVICNDRESISYNGYISERKRK